MFLKFKEAIGENGNMLVSLDGIRHINMDLLDSETLCIYYDDDNFFYIDFKDQDSLNRAYQNLCRLLEVKEV